MSAIIANRSDAVSRFRQTAVAGVFLFATTALGVSELRADEVIIVEEEVIITEETVVTEEIVVEEEVIEVSE